MGRHSIPRDPPVGFRWRRVRYSLLVIEGFRVRTKHGELSLEEVAGLLPGTGEVMVSVSHCFAMCWHAFQGGNRELATYFLNRTRNLLRGLAITRPKYAAQIREYETEFLEALYQALRDDDQAGFRAAYDGATDQANAYHVDTGHPYIRWARPAEPPDKGLL
jgi:hypothetical protein